MKNKGLRVLIDNVDTESLRKAAGTGKWDKIDLNKLSPDRLEELVIEEELLHLAAQNRKLQYVPKELMIEEAMLRQDDYGETAVHVAIAKGEFEHIPKEFLTKEILEKETIDGTTAFHFGAISGTLKYFPKELLTEKNLSYLNEYDNCPLDYAIFGLEEANKHRDSKQVIKNIEEGINILLSKMSFPLLESIASRVDEASYAKVTKTLAKKEIAKRLVTAKLSENYLQIESIEL